MEEANALEHYGTKGMRWGYRKASSIRKSDGSADHPEKYKSPEAVSALAAREKARVHGVHSLTNQELRDANTRTDLESRYKTLHKSGNQKRMEKGGKFVKNMGKAVLLAPVTVVLAGYTTNVLKNNLPK
jgi:hypothetical protein